MKSKNLILLLAIIVLVGACSSPTINQEAEIASNHFDPKGKAPTAATVAKWEALKNKPKLRIRD